MSLFFQSNSGVFGNIEVDQITVSGSANFDQVKLGSVAIPESGTALGVSGQIAYSNNSLYICVSDNVWRRTNLKNFYMDETN